MVLCSTRKTEGRSQDWGTSPCCGPNCLRRNCKWLNTFIVGTLVCLLITTRQFPETSPSINVSHHIHSPASFFDIIEYDRFLFPFHNIQGADGLQYVTIEWANYTFQHGLSRQHIVDPFGVSAKFHRRYVSEYAVDDPLQQQRQLQAYEPVLTAISADGALTGILAHHCPMQDRLEEDNLENKPVADPLVPRNYICFIELRVYDNKKGQFLGRYDYALPGKDTRIMGFSLHAPEEGATRLSQYRLTMLSWNRYPADYEVCRCKDDTGCILEPWSAVCHRNQFSLAKSDVYVWSSWIGLCHRRRKECDLSLCVEDCSHITIPTNSRWSCTPAADAADCWEVPAIPGTLGGRASVAAVWLEPTEAPQDLDKEFKRPTQPWQNSIILYPDNPYFNRAHMFKCSQGGKAAHRGIFQVDVGATFENTRFPRTARVLRSCSLREYEDGSPPTILELPAGEGACGGCESWGVVTDTRCTGFTSWCVASYGSRTPGIYLNGKFEREGTMFLNTWDLAGYASRELGDYRYANLRAAQVFSVESSTGDNSFTSLMFDIFYVIDFLTPSHHMRWGPVAMSELRVARCQQKEENMRVSFTLLKHDTLRRAWAPEILNLQAFKEISGVVIFSEDTIEQTSSFMIYNQETLGIASTFDTVISPVASLATGSRSYGNRWVKATGSGANSLSPAAAVRLGQMTPIDNEVTGGQIWAGPRFTDELSKKPRHALAMTAQLLKTCSHSRLEPTFETAPCVETCHKGLVFKLLDGAETEPSCKTFARHGQLVLFPCSNGNCSYVPFKLPQPASESFTSAVLSAAVDKNVLTSGPTFAGNTSTSSTFHFEGLADVWEIIAVFERKVSQQRDDLFFIFHHTKGQEAVRLKGGIGGDLAVPLAGPLQKGLYEAKDGAVYKWSEMDVRGVRSISVRYRTKGDYPATLREIQLKGKVENCPSHGFFADSSCPLVEFRPTSVEELDCQGEWGEWSMCDYQCRSTRFFTIKRKPRLGGKPCLLFEKRPCEGRPFCDTRHYRHNDGHYIGPDILLQNKRRDCKTHLSEWSDCVNCRQLRYTHIIMHAALDGNACPEERFEMRFCNPACEQWFLQGAASTPAPVTTKWTTRSTRRTTRVFTRTTSTKEGPATLGGMAWYYIVAIAAINLCVVLTILGTAWCMVQRRHKKLSDEMQQQESRELAEAEEEARRAEASALAAQMAASRATTDINPLKGRPSARHEERDVTIHFTKYSSATFKQRANNTKKRKSRKHNVEAAVLRAPCSREDLFEPLP
ncbi:hypothetical protein BESB_035960 [Besnoitia besnoiti]|uniref:Transmembrane protein n=1 Tax=Besnoitia besnoiti TaxID=94643 RepID=A0A2A9MF42_BESBE|nr:hypothetical protein BESB_035960 [Besnoitia besnoiti]PFH37138.1 hypothetical protein BESB_035960 [Besnoitia besnoiti]